MEVHFFNIPYLLYEGSYTARADSSILTVAEHRVGWVYNKKRFISFPIYIVTCLYDFEKDWV